MNEPTQSVSNGWNISQGAQAMTPAKTRPTASRPGELAEKSGGKIVKPAQDTFWGGYSGYFTDPDGHLWEVAYGDCWEFNNDGSLVVP